MFFSTLFIRSIMDTGVKRKTGGARKPAGGVKSNKSQKSNKSKKSTKSRKPQRGADKPSRGANKPNKMSLPSPRRPSFPRTVRAPSKRSKSVERVKLSRANSAMSLTELQFMAKSKGIPFGGLSRTKLIKKINNYY